MNATSDYEKVKEEALSKLATKEQIKESLERAEKLINAEQQAAYEKLDKGSQEKSGQFELKRESIQKEV